LIYKSLAIKKVSAQNERRQETTRYRFLVWRLGISDSMCLVSRLDTTIRWSPAFFKLIILIQYK